MIARCISLVFLLSLVPALSDSSSLKTCRACVKNYYSWCPNDPNYDSSGTCQNYADSCLSDPIRSIDACPNDPPSTKGSCYSCVQDAYIWCKGEKNDPDAFDGFCTKNLDCSQAYRVVDESGCSPAQSRNELPLHVIIPAAVGGLLALCCLCACCSRICRTHKSSVSETSPLRQPLYHPSSSSSSSSSSSFASSTSSCSACPSNSAPLPAAAPAPSSSTSFPSSSSNSRGYVPPPVNPAYYAMSSVLDSPQPNYNPLYSGASVIVQGSYSQPPAQQYPTYAGLPSNYNYHNPDAKFRPPAYSP
eukprot:TRINITY_DN2282_c0_g3_i4.p1 TRINITY_DN2282_c0_g3~~TRINITY_DN2282_c0_g3_i4.p1  ORF type:complete len:303 (-),score=70.48 TRINITY_DN2282_c0_g3_i4:240-1148(-)